MPSEKVSDTHAHSSTACSRAADISPVWLPQAADRNPCVVGPVVRIGPNDLVTNDAELLRRMWAVRSPYRKGAWYQAVRFDPTRDNIISMRNDHDHNELRAKMAIGVSCAMFLSFLVLHSIFINAPSSDTKSNSTLARKMRVLSPPSTFKYSHSSGSLRRNMCPLLSTSDLWICAGRFSTSHWT